MCTRGFISLVCLLKLEPTYTDNGLTEYRRQPTTGGLDNWNVAHAVTKPSTLPSKSPTLFYMPAATDTATSADNFRRSGLLTSSNSKLNRQLHPNILTQTTFIR